MELELLHQILAELKALRGLPEKVDRLEAKVDRLEERVTNLDGQVERLRHAVVRIEIEHGQKLDALADGQAVIQNLLSTHEVRIVRLEDQLRIKRQAK